MRLNFLKLEGFRGCRDPLEIRFGEGFTVLSGRNGVGKSTIIDAIDFALTGTINKFDVKGQRGSGLSEHIWWVGSGKPKDRYVKLGFVDREGHEIVRTCRPQSVDTEGGDLAEALLSPIPGRDVTLDQLAATSIIRDELISASSLDSTEQKRFQLVLDAIAPMTGPKLEEKVASLAKMSEAAVTEFEEELSRLENQLTNTLTELSEARASFHDRESYDKARKLLVEKLPSVPVEPTSLADKAAHYISSLRTANSSASEQEGRLLRWRAILQTKLEENWTERLVDLKRQIATKREALEVVKYDRDKATEVLDTLSEEQQRLSDLNQLIAHGEKLGPSDDHCPLCAAARTESEYYGAIERTRKYLEARDEVFQHSGREFQDQERQFKALSNEIHNLEEEQRLLADRASSFEKEHEELKGIFSPLGAPEDLSDDAEFDRWISSLRQDVYELSNAFQIISRTPDAGRLAAIEARVSGLQKQIDQASSRVRLAKLEASRISELVATARQFPNDILKEQFDTVMPLMKEFYRRLKPHTSWDEIEYNFGGKVRSSLNFSVGENYNPQFMFSSGQRRATGLAFLLSVHLARRWSNFELLALDDPVQHIDDYRALNLVEVLAAIRLMGRQILIAVEDPNLALLLGRRLRNHPEQGGVIYELVVSGVGQSRITQEIEVEPYEAELLQRAKAS